MVPLNPRSAGYERRGLQEEKEREEADLILGFSPGGLQPSWLEFIWAGQIETPSDVWTKYNDKKH